MKKTKDILKSYKFELLALASGLTLVLILTFITAKANSPIESRHFSYLDHHIELLAYQGESYYCIHIVIDNKRIVQLQPFLENELDQMFDILDKTIHRLSKKELEGMI